MVLTGHSFSGEYTISLAIFVERLMKPIRERVSFLSKGVIGWMWTLPIAMLGWIPFRAQSIGDALGMMTKVFIPSNYLHYSMRENVYLITALLTLFVTINYLLDYYLNTWYSSSRLAGPIRVVRYTTMIVLIYTFFRPVSQFIYFQF